MNKLFNLTIVIAVIMSACGNPQSDSEAATEGTETPEEQAQSSLAYFGDTIDEAGAISVVEMIQKMEGYESLETKITAEVLSVCQNKGCWLTISKNDSTEIRVRFKDYGFFVPKDCAGKKVTLKGVAYYDTMTVDILQHYAEDEGLSEEEINAITEPEVTLAFEATGAILQSN